MKMQMLPLDWGTHTGWAPALIAAAGHADVYVMGTGEAVISPGFQNKGLWKIKNKAEAGEVQSTVSKPLENSSFSLARDKRSLPSHKTFDLCF